MTNKCDKEVYEKGRSVCLVDIPKESAETICLALSAATGCRIDWHYVGGRVHIKALPADPVPPAGVDHDEAPLLCDLCGSETDDPWHFSGVHDGVESRHLHKCDKCYESGKPAGGEPEVLAWLVRDSRDGQFSAHRSNPTGWAQGYQVTELVDRAIATRLQAEVNSLRTERDAAVSWQETVRDRNAVIAERDTLQSELTKARDLVQRLYSVAAPTLVDGFKSKIDAFLARQSAPAAKCDGNHGGPRCADPECWNDSPSSPVAVVMPDFELAFEAWWEDHGQYCRAGGGSYEKTFAYRAYEAALAEVTRLNPIKP